MNGVVLLQPHTSLRTPPDTSEKSSTETPEDTNPHMNFFEDRSRTIYNTDICVWATEKKSIAETIWRTR
jgi:hypothetical protein